MSADHIGYTLKGRRNGNGWMVCCPCPNHGKGLGDRSPSLSVADGDDGALLLFCFAGCEFIDILDELKHRGLVDCSETVPTRNGFTPFIVTPAPDDRERTERAMAIWHRARPIAGTPAECFLSSRGVSDEGEALRWHPSCPFGKERLGCMVALVRNIVTNEPQAVHRTAIDAAGKKLSHLGSNGRLSFGPVSGGAVKLTDDADVSTVVAIGEGIETALSIRNLPDLDMMPVWSLISAGGISNFPVLAGVETLWISADHDPVGIGAARKAGKTWLDAGREVMIVHPNARGTDLNDVIAGAAHG